jgi:hypothetical protein
MARIPTKVRLEKTLKEGLRRCVYRRWEATVKGAVLITKTTELERMYRGNTPYPVGKPKVTRRAYSSNRLAKEAGQRMATIRARLGYRAA